MKYQLVIQWAATSLVDYDRMVDIESALEDGLSSGSEVDGHDAGSGEVNIFVHTDSVAEAFAEIRALLTAQSALTNARIAYREIGTHEYTILWPEDLDSFAVT